MEIKIKAWDKVNKIWHTWNNWLAWDSGDLNYVNTTASLKNGNRFEYVMYTGMKDKHGKEIYQGDIVRFRGYNGMTVREVKFNDKFGCFMIGQAHVKGLGDAGKPRLLNQRGIEIIGNVFENSNMKKLLENANV